MRRILVAILVIASSKVNGQDLVVTPGGDSLNCQITRLKNDTIYFDVTFKGSRQKYTLLVSETTFKYGYFKNKPVRHAMEKSASSDTVVHAAKNHFQRWHISAFGGFAQRLGSNPPGLPASVNNYLDQLKPGYTLGGQFSHRISRLFELGVLYHLFNSSHSDSSLPVTTSGGNVNLSVSDHLSLEYVGIILSIRFPVGSQGTFLFDASVGWLEYNDWSAEGATQLRLEGLTVAFGLGAGYESKLDSHWSLGARFLLTMGNINEFTLSSGGNSVRVTYANGFIENLARFDATVYLKFSW